MSDREEGIVMEHPAGMSVEARAAELFQTGEAANYRHTDRMFAWLMAVQWIVGIGMALWISPLAWEGRMSHTHIHVWAAIFLGGAAAGLPILLAFRLPGSVLTRHVVAVGQMVTSALLIDLTGGRIETHFHIFGSLAFLAFYRDWRVLLTATLVVCVDHYVRGVYWPQSIFGVATASHWRWLEHAGWVLFEDGFLLLAIRQNIRTLFGLAERQAALEALNADIEGQVTERTSELRAEYLERRRAEEGLIAAHRDLLQASRLAGMAEVATNVLHNVGNVLNSVNVSAGLVADSVRKSKVENLGKVAALLVEHEKDLGNFLSSDTRGKQIPAYLTQLSEHLLASQEVTMKELTSLNANIGHIKDIVAMQQSYAKVSGVKEVVDVASLVEDSLSLNVGALTRHQIEVIREYEKVPALELEKHKVLQILINLVGNAKYACDASKQKEKKMTLRVSNGDQSVRISVADNGEGIPAENLTRIFQHGFTTRVGGHGFGLHSSALAAKEIGGVLSAESGGWDKGATFILELPVQEKEGKSA